MNHIEVEALAVLEACFKILNLFSTVHDLNISMQIWGGFWNAWCCDVGRMNLNGGKSILWAMVKLQELSRTHVSLVGDAWEGALLQCLCLPQCMNLVLCYHKINGQLSQQNTTFQLFNVIVYVIPLLKLSFSIAMSFHIKFTISISTSLNLQWITIFDNVEAAWNRIDNWIIDSWLIHITKCSMKIYWKLPEDFFSHRVGVAATFCLSVLGPIFLCCPIPSSQPLWKLTTFM